MTDEPRLTAPTELIYPPRPSWLPLIVAAGVAAVIAGVFSGWVYSLVGAVVALVAIGRWIANVRSDIARLPRRQRITSAVLPAVELRRRGDAS